MTSAIDIVNIDFVRYYVGSRRFLDSLQLKSIQNPHIMANYFDHTCRQIAIDLNGFVLAREIITESIIQDAPQTRWHALRLAIFPKWLLRRFPIPQRRITWKRSYLFPKAPAIAGQNEKWVIPAWMRDENVVVKDSVKEEEVEEEK